MSKDWTFRQENYPFALLLCRLERGILAAVELAGLLSSEGFSYHFHVEQTGKSP